MTGRLNSRSSLRIWLSGWFRHERNQMRYGDRAKGIMPDIPTLGQTVHSSRRDPYNAVFFIKNRSATIASCNRKRGNKILYRVPRTLCGNRTPRAVQPVAIAITGITRN